LGIYNNAKFKQTKKGTELTGPCPKPGGTFGSKRENPLILSRKIRIENPIRRRGDSNGGDKKEGKKVEKKLGYPANLKGRNFHSGRFPGEHGGGKPGRGGGKGPTPPPTIFVLQPTPAAPVALRAFQIICTARGPVGKYTSGGMAFAKSGKRALKG